MFGIGMSEMLIIGIFALILIGPDQIPETARTIGKFLNELRRSTDDLKSQLTDDIKFPKSIDDIINASNKANHEDNVPKYGDHAKSDDSPKFENHPHIKLEDEKKKDET